MIGMVLCHPSTDVRRHIRPPPYDVLVVDDHPVVREGFVALLNQEPDLEVVGQAGTAEEAISLIQRAQPALVMVDLKLPGESGIDLIRHMRERWPHVKALVLSAYSDEHYLRGAAALQVEGYLLKPMPVDELVEAVRAVARGQRVYDRLVAGKMMEMLGRQPDAAPPGEALTAGELEVLRLLDMGLRNREIGKRLSVSHRTGDFHVRNIMWKLRARNRLEAVRIAREKGIIG